MASDLSLNLDKFDVNLIIICYQFVYWDNIDIVVKSYRIEILQSRSIYSCYGLIFTIYNDIYNLTYTHLYPYLRVDPLTNSLGCCKSFLYASHTRIISCNSLPSAEVFGTISQNISSSFLMV